MVRPLALSFVCILLLSSCGTVTIASASASNGAVGPTTTTSALGLGAGHSTGTSELPIPTTSVFSPSRVRSYGELRKELVNDLSGSAVPVYLPGSTAVRQSKASIDASYVIGVQRYSVAMGYGPLLPVNSLKAGFGNAELLMNVIGAGQGGTLGVSSWIPIPKNPPLRNASQGVVELAGGMTGEHFTSGAGRQSQGAVTWQEGGWTFWVGPWNTAEWGSVLKIASKIAAKFKSVSLPGKGGVAVFAGGQDAPSEALFSVGKNRYLVEALGYRAARFASEMTPAS